MTAGGSVKVWERASATLLASFEVPRKARCVAITGDGKYAVSFHGNSPGYSKFHLWNLATLKPGKATPISSDVERIAGAGDAFVTASPDSTFSSFNAWAIGKGKIDVTALFEGFRGRIQAVAITRDGKRAVASSEKGDVFVFDMTTKKQVAKVEGHNAAVRNIAITSDDRTVISLDANAILQATPMEGGTSKRIKQLMTLPLHPSAMAVSADGARVALAAHGDVQLVDLGSEKLVREWQVPDASAVVFVDDRLAVASGSGAVTLVG